MPNTRPKNSYKQWDHLEIEFPIHETLEYIVYLDAKLEVEWETSKVYDDAKKEPAEFTEIRRRYSTLESSISPRVSHNNRKHAERAIGLGIEAALRGDMPAAHKCMDGAQEFIEARNRETGKGLFVQSAMRTTGVLLAVGLLAWVCRVHLAPALGPLLFSLVLYSSGGSVGALFFVLRGVGLALPDPQADEGLHVKEAAWRILLGALGAAVVTLAIKSGVILPQLNGLPEGKYILMLIAILSGKSETFAPNLMDKLEASLKGKDTPRLKE